MKKIFVAIMSVIIALMSTLPCAALEADVCAHENCDCSRVEFVFENADIDNETAEIIINKLSGNNSDSTTYGIMCNLFGHKYETTEYVTVITHKVRDSIPRCLSEDYECQICSRCEYVEETLITWEYINCCQ